MNAKIVIEWNGKKYRITKSHICDKKHCDLYDAVKCNCGIVRPPCGEIQDALVRDVGRISKGVFKEVK